MSSAGKMLQQERLSQNRSLAEIAEETCISSRYLSAIETDDLDVLPGDFFYRSFIKQYANALKLDEQATAIILQQALPVREVDPLPAFAMAYQTAKTDRRLSGLYRPRTAVAVVLLATVLIGCSGLYAIWRNAQIQRETSPESAAAPPPAPPPPTVAPVETKPQSQATVPADPDTGEKKQLAPERRPAEKLESIPGRL